MLGANEIQGVLISLLEDSGVVWKPEAGTVRFRLKRDGMVWENFCRCLDGVLLVYGRYPFRIDGPGGFCGLCSKINSQVMEGAMFLPQDMRPAFRTTARLDEWYGARERIACALEYNGAVITRFWGETARYQS